MVLAAWSHSEAALWHRHEYRTVTSWCPSWYDLRCCLDVKQQQTSCCRMYTKSYFPHCSRHDSSEFQWWMSLPNVHNWWFTKKMQVVVNYCALLRPMFIPINLTYMFCLFSVGRRQLICHMFPTVVYACVNVHIFTHTHTHTHTRTHTTYICRRCDENGKYCA